VKKPALILSLALFAGLIIAGVASLYLSPSTQAESSHQFIEAPQEPKITILWAEWKPADYLQALTQEFTNETGIEIEIVQRSWNDWQQHFFNEMAKKSQRYDMVIGDSQWLGYGSENGHYINLTHWVDAHHVNDNFIDTAMRGYAEFPKNSARYWAIPLEGDAMGFAYRKDLFEDPAEKEVFQQRFGYRLDIPTTWGQLRDLAEFFYRPEDELWGLLSWTDAHYDGLTMALQPLLWAWGADLGDRTNYQVRGTLNGGAGTSALAFYKRLTAFNNPEWRDYYLDTDTSSNKPLIEGKVAMAMVYFAITPELLDPSKNPYADRIGFFSAPAGPASRATSLGGQGISVISYSKKKEYSFRFLEWFIQHRVQKRWSELGGLSCHNGILNSAAFLNASPMHRAFSESFGFARDFWAVPEYAELLQLSQKHGSQYLFTNDISAKDTLDNLAREWEQVFEYHGYYKE
jgi:multiple sugar transport system substrate-binding protein